MSEQLKALGERIRETRKERGLTQLELAEKVRISPTYMSEIELGKSNFGVETLIRISEELQVSTDWLIRAAVPEVNAIYQNEIHSIIKDCEPALIEYMLQMLQLMKKTSEKTGKDGPGVKFCVSDFRQSQEWRWKAGRILAWIP